VPVNKENRTVKIEETAALNVCTCLVSILENCVSMSLKCSVLRLRNLIPF